MFYHYDQTSSHLTGLLIGLAAASCLIIWFWIGVVVGNKTSFTHSTSSVTLTLTW